MIRKHPLFTAAAMALAMVAAVFVPSGAQAAPGPTVVSLTFDDNYADSAPALNLMQSRGIKGTLYVASQLLGSSPTFLTHDQLAGYASHGFEVGGRSLGHEVLTNLTPEAAKTNICANRTNLTNMGFTPVSFSYPDGAENAAVQQAVKDCGYSSGRITYDLRWSAGSASGCTGCAVAEPIPPLNPYRIRTPSTVRSTMTLADLQAQVTRAVDSGGGWVPLVFHQICNGCVTNSITQANFTALLDWLQTQPNVTIKTVGEVMGGQTPPPPSGNTVTIGAQQHTISGTNIARAAGSLVLYTPAKGATTGANQYGTEVAVVNGVVTQVQASIGNMAIPAGGVVLSGHGESSTWLKTWATVGAAVTLPGGTPPPPPPTGGIPTTNVTIGTANHAVNGTNVARAANFLVVYTPAKGATTGTNSYGFEAAVVNGVVTQVQNGVGNMAIPAGGYVLSGHGTSRTWLQTNAVVGAAVTP